MIFITNPIQCIDYKRVICISLTNYPIELTSRTRRSFSLVWNSFYSGNRQNNQRTAIVFKHLSFPSLLLVMPKCIWATPTSTPSEGKYGWSSLHSNDFHSFLGLLLIYYITMTFQNSWVCLASVYWQVSWFMKFLPLILLFYRNIQISITFCWISWTDISQTSSNIFWRYSELRAL